MSTCANISTDSKPVNFSPKKALLLCKFSRYDFEKHRNPDLSEDELIESVSFHLLKLALFSFIFFYRLNAEVQIIRV